MRFGDALEALKRGKRVRRMGWVYVHQARWLQYDQRTDTIRAVRSSGEIVSWCPMPGCQHLLSDDWVIVDEQALLPKRGEPLGGIQPRSLAEVDG